MDNAGTEAQVFLTAYGDKGQSDKLSLTSPDSTHVFAKGAESEINVSGNWYICMTLISGETLSDKIFLKANNFFYIKQLGGSKQI